MRKEYTIVDTDIHPGVPVDKILPRLAQPWRLRLEQGNRSAGTMGYWNPNGVNRPDAVLEDGTRIENDPRALADHWLTPNGIDYGILNTGSMLHLNLSPEPDYAIALISAMNDVIVEEWLPADPRYQASISVYPYDIDAAVREIHRLGDLPGVVQVIMSSAARQPYGQRYFHPIYEAACEYNLPVAIHPGTEGVGISGAPTNLGYPSSYFEWHTNLVSSYIGHMVSLVLEGVFAKFPTFKFVLLEGGVSWVPLMLWRMDKNWKALRMTTPWVDRLPSEIACEHILLSTQPVEEPENLKHFHQILDMFPAEKMLMFSTDYPHWDGDTPDFTVRQFPKELRPAIMGQNALALYGLPVVSHAGLEPTV